MVPSGRKTMWIALYKENYFNFGNARNGLEIYKSAEIEILFDDKWISNGSCFVKIVETPTDPDSLNY